MMFLFSLLVTFSISLAQENQTERARYLAESREAVVLVFTGSTMCSGAIVGSGEQVLTAYHCVASGGRPIVRTHDGLKVRGKIDRVDVSHDLAVVTLENPLSPALNVATTDAKVGEPVWVIGHPFGVLETGGFLEGMLRWSVSDGIVSNTGERAIQVSAAVNPGNSGGPVLGTSGEVVGVVSRRLNGDGLGFASHGRIAAELLDEERGRKMGPLGGTVAVNLFGTSLGASRFNLGPELEFAFRDRLIVKGSTLFGGGLASTVQRAERWTAGEVAGGLRQRIGTGPYAVRFDAYAGLANLVIRSPSSMGAGESQRVQWTPVMGFGVGLRNYMLDVSYVDEEWRLGVRLRWPGVITIF